MGCIASVECISAGRSLLLFILLSALETAVTVAGQAGASQARASLTCVSPCDRWLAARAVGMEALHLRSEGHRFEEEVYELFAATSYHCWLVT